MLIITYLLHSIHIIGEIMINIIINPKQNSIISLGLNGSASWLPLDKYIFKEDEDYSVIEQNSILGFDYPRIIKGSFLIALLKKIKKNIDN